MTRTRIYGRDLVYGIFTDLQLPFKSDLQLPLQMIMLFWLTLAFAVICTSLFSLRTMYNFSCSCLLWHYFSLFVCPYSQIENSRGTSICNNLLFLVFDSVRLSFQGDQKSPGVIPLAIKDVFSMIQDVSASVHECLFNLSFTISIPYVCLDLGSPFQVHLTCLNPINRFLQFNRNIPQAFDK